MYKIYPAMPLNIYGSSQVPARAGNNALGVTSGIHLPVKVLIFITYFSVNTVYQVTPGRFLDPTIAYVI